MPATNLIVDQTTLEAVAALQRLAEAFVRRRAQLARSAGVTVEQWRTLEAVAGAEGGGLLPSLFARDRDCAPAAVSRTLRQLGDLNLVTVAENADADGRRRRHVATREGHQLLARLELARLRAISELWGGLPADEVAEFARFAARLAPRLEAYKERPV